MGLPRRAYRREVAAYRLSEALGWGLVPPTVVRDDAPFGPGSLQLFLEADYERHYFTLLEDGGREDELQVFCAFDVVANNADRKSGHVLVRCRRAPLGHRPRPVLPRPAQAAHRHLGLRRRGGARPRSWTTSSDWCPTGCPTTWTELLSGAEAEAVLDRAARLAAVGVFPEPVGDRPPYPWPLV